MNKCSNEPSNVLEITANSRQYANYLLMGKQEQEE